MELLRSTAAAFVLRSQCVDRDIEPLVQQLSGFLLPSIPSWAIALSSRQSDATALRLVQWLHAHSIPESRFGFRGSETAMDEAAAHGFVSVVEFLHTHSARGCTRQAMDRAARGGHVAVVRFLHENRREGCTYFALTGACEKGHVAMVRYLHETVNAEYARSAPLQAAYNGHVDVLKVLDEIDRALPDKERRSWTKCWSKDVMDYAAAQGHLEAVEWLHANRSEGCTTQAMDQAAAHGHLLVVQFLYENRSERYTRRAMERAKAAGHTAVVQFLETHPSSR